MNEHHSRAIVYIDSFNLYYFLKKQKNSKNLKWLNIKLWLEKILPNLNIVEIKFFTARVTGKKDKDAPSRQNKYFGALQTIPGLQIILGSFLEKEIKIQISEDVKLVGKTFEEKGTDVNLALHLLNDAHNKKFDTAIIVSNDSDLAEVVRIVTKELNLKVGVLCPAENMSRKLTEHASFKEAVREGPIRDSQFPSKMKGKNGEFEKPSTW